MPAGEGGRFTRVSASGMFADMIRRQNLPRSELLTGGRGALEEGWEPGLNRLFLETRHERHVPR